MNQRGCTWRIACLLLTAGVVAAEPAPLANNPFDRPPSVALAAGSSTAAGQGSVDRLLDLRSTMVGVNTMLADVGGTILKPGEAIGDFTLVKVYEDRAVFLYNDQSLTVLVKPASDKKDD